jgi:hypothetical protein
MKKSDSPKVAGTHLEVVPTDKGRALAKPKPSKFRDFNRFVVDMNELQEYYKELNDNRFGRTEYGTMASGDVDDQAEWCQELVARCTAALEQYKRPENYDDPDDNESGLSHAYVAKRLGVMVASFPNANPHSPEGYMKMLVEHVAAIEGLTEPALESACREIVETQKFAPAISEVMEVVNKHVGRWGGQLFALHHVEDDRLRLIKVLIEREEQEEKQKLKDAIQQATWAAQNATSSKQKLAQDIENGKAHLARLIKLHATELEEMQQRCAKLQNDTKQAITKVIEQHAEAEKRENQANGKLQALLAMKDEAAAVTDDSEVKRGVAPQT